MEYRIVAKELRGEWVRASFEVFDGASLVTASYLDALPEALDVAIQGHIRETIAFSKAAEVKCVDAP
jgi:hypothetical protein